MADKGMREWEKEVVGKNVHSVYVFCWNCLQHGVNMPLERKCGNCGSDNTSTYYDHETIDIILSHQLEAIEREVEGLDGWTYGAAGLTKAKGRGLLERKDVLSIIKKYKEGV